ncbi:MAG: photosystem assembly protein Ycf3 [Rickettsiaceae bacterium]|jgi:Flp pilus assembly protein TadD|nr:photosystem assembly protein Ycf3 [Rickettsiaceae bacterium]
MKKLIILVALALCSACVTQEVKKTADADYLAINSAAADKLFSAGDYSKAVQLYKELVDSDKNNIMHVFKYAESLRLSGDTKAARENYDKVLKMDVNALHALEGKSLSYVADGDFKPAAVLLGQVLDNDATRWRAINGLGVIFAVSGNKKESLEYFNMALEVSKNNPTVLNNMGIATAFGGDFDKGRGLVKKSLNYISSDDLSKRQKIECNIALIYGVSGNMPQAEKILSKYLPRAEVLNNLGFYAKLANNNTLAKEYLGKALAESPVHYEKAYNNLEAIEKAK